MTFTLSAAATALLATTIQVPADHATIAAGLAAATAGDTVRVAAATWTERNLWIPDGVVLEGATGDPADVIFDGGGLERILVAQGVGAATEIRAITFRNGNHTGHGGAIYASDTDVRITDCRFENNHSGNWGGAIVFQGTSSPVLDGCTFLGNDALYGGAVFCELGSPQVLDCRFEDNTATHSGGGMQAWYPASFPVLERCVFYNNRVIQFRGGGFAVEYGTAQVTSCTFVANDGGNGEGAAIGVTSGVLTLDRSVLVGNVRALDAVSCTGGSVLTVTCTDIFGNGPGDWIGCLTGLDGTAGNFSADPLFCDPGTGDVTLQSDSPCAPGAGNCGLIGAGAVTCQPTSVAEASWGEIKARWR
ncbi:MAG: right-handed parallel beta-helix repeat-containing protein [Gemmatimonadetes bacterium]|nr:right-handed parallel beta-helix repeat-containing protein [Gemmatimonadota bacterium]